MPSDTEYLSYKDNGVDKSGINMMSMLFCKHGGLITLVCSGQRKIYYDWNKEELTSTQFVTPEFLDKVSEICEKLKISPDDLMAVMAFESWFNPAAKNPNSSATGLIQFMDSTAKGLGTTVEELARMSGVEQLDYVYKYYQPYAGKLKDVKDINKDKKITKEEAARCVRKLRNESAILIPTSLKSCSTGFQRCKWRW